MVCTFLCMLSHLSPAGQCTVADLLYPGFFVDAQEVFTSLLSDSENLAFHCSDLI